MNKEHLKKYGYLVIKNVFNNDEVEKLTSVIEKIHKESNKTVVSDLQNYEETWKFLTNNKLLEYLKELIGEKIYYLHTGIIRRENKKDIKNSWGWHRDNPCRRFGRGPDWNKNKPYDVLSVIIYLSDSSITKSGLKVIPYSHKTALNISNILRIISMRINSIKFLKPFRGLLEKFIGTIIKTQAGDCVVFYSNVLHAAIPSKSLRQNIILQFGTGNEHSKNYVNYVFHHRVGKNALVVPYDKNNKKNQDFLDLLKEKKIYYPIPETKEHIDGVSVPKELSVPVNEI